MVFSKSRVNYELLKPIMLNDAAVDYVDQIRYLGTTITSQPTFSYSSENDLRTFYKSVNSILNVIKGPNEVIKMHLLYANCVPILTYASAVKEFSAREMTSCNTALNDAIRKIFSFRRCKVYALLEKGLPINRSSSCLQMQGGSFHCHLPHIRTRFCQLYFT